MFFSAFHFSANMMPLSFCKHSVIMRNKYVVTQKFNNFATVKDDETPLMKIFMHQEW